MHFNCFEEYNWYSKDYLKHFFAANYSGPNYSTSNPAVVAESVRALFSNSSRESFKATVEIPLGDFCMVKIIPMKILSLHIILLCPHLYHFFPVSIHYLQCMSPPCQFYNNGFIYINLNYIIITLKFYVW